MSITNLEFRLATREDIPLIFYFIKELAAYEKLSDEVIATEELLNHWIFEEKKAEVIIAEYEGVPAGFALYFYNFSTFVGRAGIYLEDLYVLPEYRRKGIGKAFFEELARIATKKGCGRLEWACLDWNQPSINFYLSLGAKPMSDWTVYRLTSDKLKDLGAEQ